MKKNNKALLVTLSAVALVVATIFGTMAYFTDQEAVINTFTIGQVHLSLDEADVKTDGTYETDKDARVTENKYHLIPGHTYIKDPTVHVQKGSENCYVFVTVDNQIADIEWDDEGYNSIVTQMTMNGWKLLSKADAGSIGIVQKDKLNVFVYGGEKSENDVVPKNEDVDTDLVVFNEFRIDGNEVDNTKIANYNTETKGTVIKVTAYAVQADGFKTALEAWNAANGQFK